MSRYRDQVAAALRAVTIRGETRYAWLGRASRPLPAALVAEMDGPQRRAYLVACLREELYASFYCHGRPVPARWGEPGPASADPWLAQAMSEANAGRGSWEPGWTVQRVDGDDAIVATPHLRARVPIAECRAFDGTVRAGSAMQVRLPKELPALSPGFYTVVADAVTETAGSEAVVRVYWNIAHRGAPDLVRAVTSRLNAEDVPFRLKVADHAHRLDRCDSAVLYLRAETFPALRGMILRIAADLTARLRAEIPAFTLELVPGVGLAEDDGVGESFGVRRCALLADGILRAHEQPVAPIDALVARFAEAGVAIDAPYRDPCLAGGHVL